MQTQNRARAFKPGAVLQLYKDLWRYVRGERHVFLGAVVLLISAQIALLAIPYLSGRALNALQLHGLQGARDAGFWLLMTMFVAIVSWISHGPGRVLERRAALVVRSRMSQLLAAQLFALPLRWHETNHSAATAHRVQQSTHALSGFAQSQFIYLNSAVRLLGPLVALWCIQPLVGFTAVAGLTGILLSVAGFDRAMIRLANQENDAERSYASALADTLANATTVYSLRQARGVMARLERRLLAVFIPLRRAILLNELKWCTVDLSSRALSCGLVALFAWLAVRSESGGLNRTTLLLGSIYMVWEYAQQAGGVVSSIASHFQTFARQQADYASADMIRRAAPSTLAAHAPRQGTSWRHLIIRDLSFSHGTKLTLDRVGVSLERGKRYALIGGSGSGKSTLLRLLAGLYSADRVALAVDLDPIRVSPQEAAGVLRATSTLIPQDAEVYEGTLAENLGLCESVNGPPSETEFEGALGSACADFVQSSPEGLHAPVAERAVNWSGGQRSRIALARGVLAAHGSSLVLMDEPTASLDPATESQVYTNLFAQFADACVVSSVHRLNLLDRFDEVLVMCDGKLVAQGRVADLTLLCPEFQRLTQAQRRQVELESDRDRSNVA